MNPYSQKIDLLYLFGTAFLYAIYLRRCDVIVSTSSESEVE